MSYSIVTVVYGIPMTVELYEFYKSFSDIEYKKYEDFGFQQLYSAFGYFTPSYCGIVLDEFDECQTHLDFSELKVNPTMDQIKEAQKLIDTIPEIFKPSLLPMKTYFIFSSS